MPVSQYIAAIDQGTTSSRCMIFDHAGQVVGVAQKEHDQIFPKPGWVEHDAVQLWSNTREMVGSVLAKTNLTAGDIAAVGITNQRETTVVWDRETGEPVYNAIVWQDTRTDRLCDELAGRGGPRAVPRGHRVATVDVLRGSQGALDPRQCRGRPTARRGRASCVSARSTRGSSGTSPAVCTSPT